MSRFRSPRDQPLGSAGMVFDADLDNRSQRVPVVMIMDNSSSMQGRPIGLLNEALADMQEDLRHDVELSAKAEICLITFGADGVTAWHGKQRAAPGVSPFVPASRFEVPKLEANGVTPMVEAIELAMRLVTERKRELRSQNLSFYRPVMWCVSDGEPTGRSGYPTDDWQKLPAIIAREEGAKRFVFFTVSVGDISARGDEVLRALAPRAHLKLKGFVFRDVLQLVSASAESAAHNDPIDAIKERVMREFAQIPVEPI
jgi:uncharacterized protein YegL